MSNRLAGASDAFLTALNTTGPGGSLALVYSTYVGGTNDDHGGGIAATPDGIACLTGWTRSTNFPVKGVALQTKLNNVTNHYTVSDAFVAKFDPAGIPLYSSFLGGSNTDTGFRIALDSDENMYITGSTFSTNFPLSGVLGRTHSRLTNGNPAAPDVFLTKLTSAGQITSSMVFGGTARDEGWSVGVDAGRNVYIVGTTSSTNFFMTNAPIPQCAANSGGKDAFISAVSADFSSFLYSFYLGGKGDDSGMGVAVDPAGNAYIIGETASTNFPVTSLSQRFGGTNDAFIARIGTDLLPNLISSLQGSNFNLKWLANQPDYSLQQSLDGAKTWTTVSAAPPATNGFHSVAVAVTNGFSEFRLHRN
jgi:hypothetical protein